MLSHFAAFLGGMILVTGIQATYPESKLQYLLCLCCSILFICLSCCACCCCRDDSSDRISRSRRERDEAKIEMLKAENRY